MGEQGSSGGNTRLLVLLPLSPSCPPLRERRREGEFVHSPTGHLGSLLKFAASSCDIGTKVKVTRQDTEATSSGGTLAVVGGRAERTKAPPSFLPSFLPPFTHPQESPAKSCHIDQPLDHSRAANTPEESNREL